MLIDVSSICEDREISVEDVFGPEIPQEGFAGIDCSANHRGGEQRHTDIYCENNGVYVT